MGYETRTEVTSLNNEILLSIGGGIGQSRALMLLLRKAHPGEVSATVAEDPEGNVRGQEYFRAGVGWVLRESGKG